MDRQASYAPAVHDWAYKSMHCAYGYEKSPEGYCTALGWYGTTLGCYETTLIHRMFAWRHHWFGLGWLMSRDHVDH